MTYDELETLVWQELMDIVGAGDGAPPVRRSWAGLPDWKIDDDVIFMQLAETDDDIAVPLDTEYREDGSGLIAKQGTSRVFTLRLNAYGPNAYDSLLRIRTEILRGRKNLRLAKVYPVPERSPIIRAPELFQGRWWNRADIALKFNVLMIFEADIGTIESVNVTVRANRQHESKIVLDDGVHVGKDG